MSLFPIIFEIRFLGIPYKRIGHCCGLDYYMAKLWLLIRFAFQEKIYWRCSQCGKIHCIKLSYHTEDVWSKEMREENRKLENFRNG